MGLTFSPYAAKGQKAGSERYLSYHAIWPRLIKVAGYDYYLRMGPQMHEDSCGDEGSLRNNDGTLGHEKFNAYLNTKESRFLIIRDKETVGSVDVMPLVRELRKKYKDALESYVKVPQRDMMMEGKAGNVAVKLYFSDINIKELNDALELTSATGDALLKVGE
jgi:hypothetical protein